MQSNGKIKGHFYKVELTIIYFNPKKSQEVIFPAIFLCISEKSITFAPKYIIKSRKMLKYTQNRTLWRMIRQL